MVITYKTVNKLKFPVFLLSSSNWHLADGLLFLDEKLLDDRNMPGDSMDRRIKADEVDFASFNDYDLRITNSDF